MKKRKMDTQSDEDEYQYSDDAEMDGGSEEDYQYSSGARVLCKRAFGLSGAGARLLTVCWLRRLPPLSGEEGMEDANASMSRGVKAGANEKVSRRGAATWADGSSLLFLH